VVLEDDRGPHRIAPARPSGDAIGAIGEKRRFDPGALEVRSFCGAASGRRDDRPTVAQGPGEA
jgi:hypothetical protein